MMKYGNAKKTCAKPKKRTTRVLVFSWEKAHWFISFASYVSFAAPYFTMCTITISARIFALLPRPLAKADQRKLSVKHYLLSFLMWVAEVKLCVLLFS